MIFLTLLIIPIIIALCFYLMGGKKVTWKEFLIQCGVQVVIVAISVGAIYFKNMYDIEIWNGYVTGKEKVRVHCRHSYRCMCVESCSGSGENRVCTQICQTCYDHSYDNDWLVYTNLDHTFDIDTLDSQGLKEPPRWTGVVIGEPISLRMRFENFIKASKDTLFRKKEINDQFAKSIPRYPDDVYDYWRLDRVIPIGVKIENIKDWNYKLAELNGKLGKTKEANIVFIFTKFPKEYGLSLEQHWEGGKKNDIIVVTGLEEDKINWVYVIAWCENNIFKVKLRDDILALKTLDQAKFLSVVEGDVVKYYKRQSFENYRYLATSVTPTFGEWLVSMITGTVVAFGLGLYLYYNEFEE